MLGRPTPVIVTGTVRVDHGPAVFGAWWRPWSVGLVPVRPALLHKRRRRLLTPPRPGGVVRRGILKRGAGPWPPVR